MSAATITIQTRTGHDLSFAGVLHSEWIKLRSIRSTWWCFAILVALTVGLGAQMSSALDFEGVSFVATSDAKQAMAVYAATVSLDFGALVVSVLGVLIIAGEYGTGMIRSTLTAVPKRLPALFAKAIVFGAATFAVSALTFAVTAPVSVAMLAGNGVEVDLGDGQYWLSLFGAVAYLVLVGLISFSIGAIIRNTAGGIAVSVGLVLAAPLAFGLVGGISPVTWMQNVEMLLPSNLGRALFAYPAEWAGDPDAPVAATPEGLWSLEPWQAGLVLVAWVVALLTSAAVLLKHRDA